jgi:hypothetical protein
MVDSASAPALVAAIHSGDVTLLQQLLDANPGLAAPPLGGPFKTRTPLHARREGCEGARRPAPRRPTRGYHVACGSAERRIVIRVPGAGKR